MCSLNSDLHYPPFLCFLLFGGTHSEVLRASSCFCTQESLLMVHCRPLCGAQNQTLGWSQELCSRKALYHGTNSQAQIYLPSFPQISLDRKCTSSICTISSKWLLSMLIDQKILPEKTTYLGKTITFIYELKIWLAIRSHRENNFSIQFSVSQDYFSIEIVYFGSMYICISIYLQSYSSSFLPFCPHW